MSRSDLIAQLRKTGVAVDIDAATQQVTGTRIPTVASMKGWRLIVRLSHLEFLETAELLQDIAGFLRALFPDEDDPVRFEADAVHFVPDTLCVGPADILADILTEEGNVLIPASIGSDFGEVRQALICHAIVRAQYQTFRQARPSLEGFHDELGKWRRQAWTLLGAGPRRRSLSEHDALSAFREAIAGYKFVQSLPQPQQSRAFDKVATGVPETEHGRDIVRVLRRAGELRLDGRFMSLALLRPVPGVTGMTFTSWHDEMAGLFGVSEDDLKHTSRVSDRTQFDLRLRSYLPLECLGDRDLFTNLRLARPRAWSKLNDLFNLFFREDAGDEADLEALAGWLSGVPPTQQARGVELAVHLVEISRAGGHGLAGCLRRRFAPAVLRGSAQGILSEWRFRQKAALGRLLRRDENEWGAMV